MTSTHLRESSPPAKPISEAKAKASRQSRVRWHFWSRIGALRMAEAILRSIWSEYANVNRPAGTVIDPKLEDAISRARRAIADVHARMLDSHRNDWRKTP